MSKEITIDEIGRRMGLAFTTASKIPDTEQRRIMLEALSYMALVLKELKRITPAADVYGHMTIENEMLKEEVRLLREAVSDIRYEEKLKEYSHIDVTGIPYCGA